MTPATPSSATPALRDLFSLSGQTAVVTSAASGIDRAIALGLAAVGADVACVDRNPDGLADTVATISDGGRAAGAFQADVTDAAAIRQALGQVDDPCLGGAVVHLGEPRLTMTPDIEAMLMIEPPRPVS